MSLRAGDLRTELVLQQKATTPGQGGGQKITGWQDMPDVIYAKMETLRATEAIIAGVERSTTLYRITIRYMDGVSPKQRFRWAGGFLDIKSAGDPDGRREALIITAETASA